MPSIRSRVDSSLLFFEFRYEGQRCREQTLLEDTPANRKKLQKVLDKIESEINAGNLVQQGDKLYAAGMSPHEVREDYEAMTDLVRQVIAYCKGAPLKTTGDLDEMLARESQILTSQFHVRPAYVVWVMARVRAQLKEAGLDLADSHQSPPHPDA